ncbi:hypothetical protein [Streptomyces sp. URMC 124]
MSWTTMPFGPVTWMATAASSRAGVTSDHVTRLFLAQGFEPA